jgi:hypothetical protein
VRGDAARIIVVGDRAVGGAGRSDARLGGFWRQFFGLPDRSIVTVGVGERTLRFWIEDVSAVGDGLVRVACEAAVAIKDPRRFAETAMAGRDMMDVRGLSAITAAYARSGVESKASEFLVSDLVSDEVARETLRSEVEPLLASQLSGIGCTLGRFQIIAVESGDASSGPGRQSREGRPAQTRAPDEGSGAGRAEVTMGALEHIVHSATGGSQDVDWTFALMGEIPPAPGVQDRRDSQARIATRLIALGATLVGPIVAATNDSLSASVRQGLNVQAFAAAAIVGVEALRIHWTRTPRYAARRTEAHQRAVYESLHRGADKLMRSKVSRDLTAMAGWLRAASASLADQGQREAAIELRDLAHTFGQTSTKAALTLSAQATSVGRRAGSDRVKVVNALDWSIISSVERLKGVGRQVVRDAEAGAVEEIELSIEALNESLRDLDQAIRDREMALQV